MVDFLLPGMQKRFDQLNRRDTNRVEHKTINWIAQFYINKKGTFIPSISSGPELSDVKVRGCQDLASAFFADRFHVVYVTVLRSISFSKPRI